MASPTPVPGLLEIDPYVGGRAAAPGAHRIFKLSSNESPLGASPRAAAAYAEAAAKLAVYPEGSSSVLREAVAELYGLNPARIVCGNGSDELLHLIAQCYCRPGDEVLFSEHGFLVYPIAARAASAIPVTAPETDFTASVDALIARLTAKTRLVFIANPNNPTGTWLAPAELEAFIASLPAQVLCVLDEAYGEYMSPGQLPDSVGWLERYPNLVITRTFSKAYGLAGLRVGYALAHAQVTDLLNRVRQPFNVNLPALTAATAALGDAAYLAEAVALNRSGLQQWQDGLTALGLGWLPSAGNFLCVDLKGRSGRELFQRLLPKGVILRPVDNYGLPGHIRVTLGTGRENAIALAALGEVLAAG